MKMRLAPALTGVLALAVGASLAGCAVVDDLAHGYADSTYDTAGVARDALGAAAEWIPADATDIRVRSSTRGDAGDAVVQVDSGEALDTALCEAGPRMSGAAWYFDDSPDVLAIADAYVCGEWTVVAAEGGWFGWTPNSPAERQAAGVAD